MNLDRGAVQRNHLKFDGDYLLLLQAGKDPIQHARLGPTIHARIDRVPISQGFRQPPPFATMLSHIENSVEDLLIAQAHIATLARQAVSDP